MKRWLVDKLQQPGPESTQQMRQLPLALTPGRLTCTGIVSLVVKNSKPVDSVATTAGWFASIRPEHVTVNRTEVRVDPDPDKMTLDSLRNLM